MFFLPRVEISETFICACTHRGLQLDRKTTRLIIMLMRAERRQCNRKACACDIPWRVISTCSRAHDGVALFTGLTFSVATSLTCDAFRQIKKNSRSPCYQAFVKIDRKATAADDWWRAECARVAKARWCINRVIRWFNCGNEFPTDRSAGRDSFWKKTVRFYGEAL